MQSPFQLLLDLFDEPKPAPRPKRAPQVPTEELVSSPGEPFDQVLSPQAFRHPDANREVLLGTVLVAYEFRRAKRKNIGFSVGAEGLMIRGGVLAEPVRELTVASTIQRMLKDALFVGNDMEWLPGSAAGVSLAIADMSMSGA